MKRLDRIKIAFDDHRLASSAGLILPVTLAHHPGPGNLLDYHVDLGNKPGRANAGDTTLTLTASALTVATALMTPARCSLVEQSGCWVMRPRRHRRWGLS